MDNKIDIVDFAKDVLGIKLSKQQEILLRRIEEAKENNETLVINFPRCGKSIIKNIMEEYEKGNF